MTPQDIISSARYILNDTTETYRQSNAELLGYVNDALREAVVINPALFTVTGDYSCIVGQCEQALSFVDAAALVEVLSIKDGDALTPFDVAALNAFHPAWRTDTAGPAQQWAKLTGDPLRFFIYPKAPVTAQVLEVKYVKIPAVYSGLTDVITELPGIYSSALTDYVVHRAESKDDEHVVSQRAQAAYAAFAAKIKG